MKKIFYCCFLPVVILALQALSAHGQKSVLLIGAGATSNEYASDQDFMDNLTEWGYTVEYIDDDVFNSAVPTWDNYLGVFINETVGSGNVAGFATAFNYPVPCVCLEGWAPNSDRWAWLSSNTDDYKENETGTEDELTFVVFDNSHYITEIYDINEEIEWSTYSGDDLPSIRLRAIKEVNVTYTAKLGKSLALVNEEDYWGMVAIDSSGVFPNRMLWWGLNNWGMNGSENTGHYMTEGLFEILKRCCDWAYKGEEVASMNRKRYEDNHRLTAFPNPSSALVTISFNAENVVDAIVTLYNITGQKLEVLLDKQTAPGKNFVTFNTDKYEAGVYFVKLQIEDNTEYIKVIIK
jgi:hypothetical protein